MKKVIVLSVLLLLTLILSAQTPQSFRYQAVARDNSGAVLANQNVSFQISILSGSVSGTEVYKETHTGKTTNAFGLVDLEIGKGTPVTGTFSAINWESNLYFVKVDMDPAGGSAYQVLSTSQLLSVPYALYSEKAGNGFSGDYNDLLNKPLLFDGAWNSLTGKPSTLSGYGITDGINTSHPANGITSGMITNWNTAYNWGNHAGLYKPLSYQPLWTEITSVPAGFADGTDNVNDADNSITNEIQVLSLTGNALSLSKEGGTVTIPGDNWGTQAVVTDATLAGNGTATAPLQIARQTAIAGQVLKWNGSAWNPADDDTSSVLKIALPYAGRAAGENFLFSIINEGQGNGIRGETISGTGLLGLASATAAMNIGTAGQSASSSGVGIWGNNIALTGNGIAVKGSVQSSTGYSGFFERGKFYIEGNTGIGTLNPATKLEVAGQVKITGGNPGAGKILTSDASGLATWQTPESSLTLPYSGTVSTTGDQAFSIWNTGTGNGIHAMANSGNGLVGYSYGGTNTSGIMGIASGSGDNQGVSGSSNSSLGTGVSGSASSLTGTTIGVSGLVFSPDGYSGFFEGGKFYISGNAGIGVTAPSAKLDVNGQIKIRGGSPGTGKVLTSDASGLAVWADPEGLRLPFSDTVSTPRPLISICNSGSGNGILAISKQITGTTCGIAGEAWSSSGAGIIGSSYSTTGTNYGVKGKTYSADGFSGYFDGGKFYISGMTGLGTATPSQRLHIKGNVPGNAVVLIEPNKWEAAGDYGELRFGDANHYIRGEHTKGMTFNDANKFSFTGGNVGIGTDSPVAKLDVAASQGPNIIIRDSDAGAGRPGIQFVNNDIHFIGSDDTTNEIFGFYSGYGNNRNYAARINVHGPATSNWGKYIGLTHDGTNGIIDTDTGYLLFSPGSGRVGIGTAAPEGIFDVAGGKIIFRPNASDKTKILVHDYIGTAMRIYTDFLSGTPYDLILGTYPNGQINQLFLKQSNGFVGIRTSSPLQALDVNGNARFQSIASDAYFGALNRKSDGTLTTATSDIRLKNNIKTIQNSLEKVLQLRGVSFTWKSNPEYGTRIGFIAQEFEQVIPELVFTNEVDGYKGINYAEVTAVLVEAIKELKAENDILKQRLEKIEALSGYKAEK